MTGQSAKPADTALASARVYVCTRLYLSVSSYVYVKTNLNIHKRTHIYCYTVHY